MSETWDIVILVEPWILDSENFSGTGLKSRSPRVQNCPPIICSSTRTLFGMAALPILCRDPFFNQNIIALKCKLGRFLPIFYFYLGQKTNLHLYKWSRLSSLLFTFFRVGRRGGVGLARQILSSWRHQGSRDQMCPHFFPTILVSKYFVTTCFKFELQQMLRHKLIQYQYLQ